MKVTLEIDSDVLEVAGGLGQAEGRPLGAIISELARNGIPHARLVTEGGVPVIRTPAGSPPITPEMVSEALPVA